MPNLISEADLVSDLYGKVPNATLAGLLGVSVRTLNRVAKRLGLIPDREPRRPATEWGEFMDLPLHGRRHPNLHTTVDVDDGYVLQAFRWHPVARAGGGFFARTKHEGRAILLHVFLVNPPAGHLAVHLDGDGLNNRRSNLRAMSRAEFAGFEVKPSF